jgi:hypothetical protein
MNALEKGFEVLVSDRDIADSFIKGYADRNLRLIVMIGTVVTMRSWVLSEKQAEI